MRVWPLSFKLKFLFLFFFLDFCKSASKDLAEGKEWVISEGEAMIYEGDVAFAKERALFYAKKNAVAQKLGTLITSKTVSESGVWVKGEVIGKSEGLVKEYVILEEKKYGDLYKIKIKSFVSEKVVKETVEELLENWERPILFNIVDLEVEKEVRDPFSNYVVESLQNFFQKKGFLIKKVSQLTQKISSPIKVEELSRLNEEEDLDFDLLIFGSSTCANSGKVMDSKLVTASAMVKISLYDPYTGLFYGNSIKNGAQAHVHFETACSKALQKISLAVAEELYQELLGKWERGFSKGRPIFLEIQGNFTYRQFYELQKEIREKFRGVEAVLEKKFSKPKKELMLMFTGRPSDLVEEFMQKNISSLKVTLISRKGNKFLLEAR